MGGLQLLIYGSVVVLIAGILFKAIKIAKMPMHLRWELYPVPHQKGKVLYGGSYFEELNWWTRPPEKSLIGELKEMAREIFYIKSLFHNNRSLWLFSFPFHIGLYFSVCFIGLLIVSAVLRLVIATGSPGLPILIEQAIHALIYIFGILGITLGGIGALGLLILRIFKSELRNYSTRADYFNLLLILALFVSCFVSWYSLERSFEIYRVLADDLIAFRPISGVPAAVALNLIISAVFIVYLPFTHMTHFIGKYFTFHKVRWQDDPNVSGSKVEKGVTEMLGNTLSWSGTHIKSGASWAEAASGETGSSEEDGN